MLVKKLVPVMLSLAILAVAVTAYAQSETTEQPKKTKTLGQRLDNLGKFIFGGTIPPEKDKTAASEVKTLSPIEYPYSNKSTAPGKSTTPSRSTVTKPSSTAKPSSLLKPSVEMPSASTEESYNPYAATRRAGSVLEKEKSESSGIGASVKGPMMDSELTPENTPPAVTRAVEEKSQPSSRAPAYRAYANEEKAQPSSRAPAYRAYANEEKAQSSSRAPAYRSYANEEKPQPSSRAPAYRAYTNEEKDSASNSVAEVERSRPTYSNKSEAEHPAVDTAPAADSKSQRALHERLSAMRVSVFSTESSEQANPQPSSHQKAAVEPPSTSSETTTPTSKATAAPSPQPALVKPVNSRADAEHSTAPESMPKVVGPKSSETLVIETARQNTADDENMLIARKGPALSVETVGPRRIMVGKEAVYEVSMMNSGEVAADELTVFVTLPEWTEVMGVDVTSGEAKPGSANQGAGVLAWRLNRLDAKGRERMTLHLTPRQSKPFDLAVRWEYKPVASQAAIEVQEPKLALQLDGPREVLYGKKETYRLKLLNIGNGRADNVLLTLMPIGGGESLPATHRIGTLAASEEKILEVELTARQAGNLTIQVSAKADSNAKCDLTEKVIVRRAGLKVDMEGPKMQFVGATTSYSVRVRNPGTAPASNISVAVALPAGAKYVSGIEGAKVDAASGRLKWTISAMAPEAEQVFAIKCTLSAAGINRVQAVAAADDDLNASTETVTRVESVANLTMEVRDPESPVQVGDEATYEVHVRNRGTKAAMEIEIAAFFSRGIEPVSAEGTQSRVTPGQVTFQPIPLLAPGAEVVLKVRAKADVAGNHIFRAEAQCKPLGTRLIREATNLYYTEALASEPTPQRAEPENPAASTIRTSSRPMSSSTVPAVPMRK